MRTTGRRRARPSRAQGTRALMSINRDMGFPVHSTAENIGHIGHIGHM